MNRKSVRISAAVTALFISTSVWAGRGVQPPKDGPSRHRPRSLPERALLLPRAHLEALARRHFSNATEAQIQAYVTGLVASMETRAAEAAARAEASASAAAPKKPASKQG